MYGHIYIYIPSSPVKIQTPTHWNLTGCSMTALPLVLSPSSLLPLLCLIFLSFHKENLGAHFNKCYLNYVNFVLIGSGIVTLSLGKPGSVCTVKMSELTVNAIESIKFQSPGKTNRKKRTMMWMHQSV